MASASYNRWTIYTIGTSGADQDKFIQALQKFKIRTVIDVRISPNNHQYPQYKLANLKKLCLENGIQYVWKGQQFGGVHQTKQLIQKLSDNTAEQASFFLRATFSLIEHPSVILCQEAKAEHCIRRHIADALIAYNLAHIKHIYIGEFSTICEDYTVSKDTKINIVSDTKASDNDDEKKETNCLPNEKVMRNNSIQFLQKLPKELSRKNMNGFRAALCIIPPVEIWPAIQEIREKHDAAYRRWQPHINILYPFVGEQYFESQISHIEHALRGIQPFDIVFKRFNFFDKGGSAKDPDPECYVFLQPSPADTIGELQKMYDALTGLYPFCALKKHNQGFKGHLTCAQFARSECVNNIPVMNAEWKALSFKCEYVCLIARIGDEQPFQIRYKIKLGTDNKTPLI
eukprot:110918_1